MAFHRETQGTLLTLLVPFRNVISERRMLQNKSGEIYGRKSGESEKVKSGEISGQKWRNLCPGYVYVGICIYLHV